METATISTRTIDISGMTGDVCVQKVIGALKGVGGVTIRSVKVGAATIGADQAGCDAACAAINMVGFKAHAAACDGGAKPGDADMPSSALETKAGGQCCTSDETAANDNACPGAADGSKETIRSSGSAPLKLAGSQN